MVIDDVLVTAIKPTTEQIERRWRDACAWPGPWHSEVRTPDARIEYNATEALRGLIDRLGEHAVRQMLCDTLGEELDLSAEGNLP